MAYCSLENMSVYGAVSTCDPDEENNGSPVSVIHPAEMDIAHSHGKYGLYDRLERNGLWKWTLVVIVAMTCGVSLYAVYGGFGYVAVVRSVFPSYNVYVLRHAERKYADIYKCDPVQDPKLPSSMGDCGDWGDNRCGGDYLTNKGLDRARCIADHMEFEGLSAIVAQYPGTCFDNHVKREYQTVLPLSQKTGIPIDVSVRRDDEWGLAEKLRGDDMRMKMCGTEQFGFPSSGTETASTYLGRWTTNLLGALVSGLGETLSKSIVVCWNHSNMPDLLKFLGCTEGSCTEKLAKLEFDTYYKVTLSCLDGKLVNIVEMKEGCNDAFEQD